MQKRLSSEDPERGINTEELENVLQNIHPGNFSGYLAQEGVTEPEAFPFGDYFKSLVGEKGLQMKDIFIWADIPERYGYKLLSGEKHTQQRDIILRLCYAAKLSPDEVQRALKLYGMSPLYARFPRDAMLMIVFRDRPGNILDVNTLLRKNKLEVLKSCGVQE